MRHVILYTRSQVMSTHEMYVGHFDELWHRAGCEGRAAERLEKLLNKYR
jgi:hypothetical protein